MPPAVESKRLFIAICLSEEIKRVLSNIIEELKKSGSDTKWIERENIHLTIKFLGNTPIEKVKAISKVLSETCLRESISLVVLEKLESFPSLSAPRVIWVGLKDAHGFLKRITQTLEGSLEKIGVEKEIREFQAHITLGRMRSLKNKISLIEKINIANADFNKKTFPIDNITLFESLLTPKGPIHSILHQIKLSEKIG
jgi:2'-5' RNA ligase